MPPVFEYNQPDGSLALAPWVLADYRARAAADDGLQPEYEHADWGIGPEGSPFLWSCCPRFSLEFASDGARLEARRIMKMLRASEDPILALSYDGRITPREAALYRLAKHLESHERSELMKRKQEEARLEAERNADRMRQGLPPRTSSTRTRRR